MPDGVTSAGRDWLTVIRRRGWIIAQVVVVVVLASYLASRLQPEAFQTHSVLALYSEKRREGLGEEQREISPDVQVQMIESESVLEEVAEAIGVGKTPASFALLRRQIDPRVGKSSDSTTLVSVYVEHRSPQTAADIASTAARAFVRKAQEDATRSGKLAREHLSKLVETIRHNLEASEDRVKRFKETGSPLASTDDAGASSRIANYAAVEGELSQTGVAIATTQAEAQRVRGLLGEVPERREQRTTVRNPLGETLRRQIMDLEIERSALLQEYTEESEEVKLVDRRLKDLRDALDEEVEQVTDQIVDQPNDIFETLRKQEVALEAELSSLQARQRALQSLLKRRQEEATGLPADQTEITRMLREQRVQEQLYTLLLQRKYEMEIEQMRQPVVAELMQDAIVPTTAYRPNRKLYVAIGFVAGILLGLIIAGLVDQLDDTFGDASEVERYVDRPVVGVVPASPPEVLPLPVVDAPTSAFAEAVRAAAAAIQSSWGESPTGLLVVTGPEGREGKSVIAANLAAALAETGRSVILVDADLRTPVLHEHLAVSRAGGLSDTIQRSEALSALLRDTSCPGLHFLAAGSENPNPGALLGSERARAVWEQLRGMADLVVIDTPPVAGLPDAALVARHAEAALIVLSRSSKRHAAADTVISLTRAGTRVLGVLRNGERAHLRQPRVG